MFKLLYTKQHQNLRKMLFNVNASRSTFKIRTKLTKKYKEISSRYKCAHYKKLHYLKPIFLFPHFITISGVFFVRSNVTYSLPDGGQIQ